MPAWDAFSRKQGRIFKTGYKKRYYYKEVNFYRLFYKDI